jgi:hypothetical protein
MQSSTDEPRQALVFLTHIESIRILAHYERLKRETLDLIDTYLCVHESAAGGSAPRILPADIRLPALAGADYAPKRFNEMLQSGSFAGYVDLIIVPVLTSERLGQYPYVWVVEYDVDYAGDWADFFARAMRSRADYVATTIVSRPDCEDWYWWSSFRAPPSVAPAQQARSFAPIARFSQRLLECYRASIAEGSWGGHSEALYPTIALHAGLAVEDLRLGKHYTNTPGDWQLSPGTFVYRPAVAEMYYHENQNAFRNRGLLYHPVKTSER